MCIITTRRRAWVWVEAAEALAAEVEEQAGAALRGRHS